MSSFGRHRGREPVAAAAAVASEQQQEDGGHAARGASCDRRHRHRVRFLAGDLLQHPAAALLATAATLGGSTLSTVRPRALLAAAGLEVRVVAMVDVSALAAEALGVVTVATTITEPALTSSRTALWLTLAACAKAVTKASLSKVSGLPARTNLVLTSCTSTDPGASGGGGALGAPHGHVATAGEADANDCWICRAMVEVAPHAPHSRSAVAAAAEALLRIR